MKYEQFLETKKKEFIESGFEVKELNKYLKPFQEYQVRVALKKGRFALFDDCGLGKTLMQLSCASRFSVRANVYTPPLALKKLKATVSSSCKHYGVK